jgi:hypothetical protein
MAECPSKGWDRYIEGEEEKAEARAEEEAKVSTLMLKKWNQATGCPHDSWEAAARCFYKYTACGPYLHARPGHLVIGSIVEGVDECPQDEILIWPFKVADVRRAIRSIEEEAEAIYNDTHGCDACGPEGDNGARSVNPECKVCGGSGIPI